MSFVTESKKSSVESDMRRERQVTNEWGFFSGTLMAMNTQCHFLPTGTDEQTRHAKHTDTHTHYDVD